MQQVAVCQPTGSLLILPKPARSLLQLAYQESYLQYDMSVVIVNDHVLDRMAKTLLEY